MTDKDDKTIRSAFWMPRELPEGSNFRIENPRSTCGDMGDVAGPQPEKQDIDLSRAPAWYIEEFGC